MLKPGLPVPDAVFTDDGGEPFRLGELLGSWVVMWWFAKAATSG